MSCHSKLIQSDKNMSTFIIQFFKFLMQFDHLKDPSFFFSTKEQAIIQSFINIKHLIFYYEMRDLCLQRLNEKIPSFFYDKTHFIKAFKEKLVIEDISFQNFQQLFNNYFATYITPKERVIICIKNSSPSILWKNEQAESIFFIPLANEMVIHKKLN